MDTCKRCEGIGITPRELKPGTKVIVPVGRLAAMANGDPCVIAWATVMGPVDPATNTTLVDPTDTWWLDVHMVPGPESDGLPQMYRAEEILGIPAPSLVLS